MEPEPSWSWPPGHELAPRLLAWALLGDGRRCETWLAWDLGRWCPVAVKLPRPGQGARAAAGLAREAQVAGATAHPGIRRLLEARLDQPVPSLIFEYVEGPTLDDALATDGPFHPVDVLLVGLQLAAALGHLHGRGLAHLDLKPGNVVLREERPVLIDLGLAQPIGRAPAGRHRRGSPPWMAPEQVRRRPASPGMDLFALGAVLFELATGTQAFDPAGDGPPERRWPQLAGRRRRPAAATRRCRPPSTGPSPPCWPPTRPTARPPPTRRWPCWPPPCRPTRPRRTGCGPAGLPDGSATGKRPPWRVSRSFHDLRRHCRWGRDAPCQDGCKGKDFGSLRERSQGRPSWGSGGCGRVRRAHPTPGLHGGLERSSPG
jgi:eukaryotic-like serine/threonine-protein kinase